MQLKEFAEQIRQLRIATINNPAKGGFVFNNGTWLRAMSTELYYEIDGTRTPSGLVQMYYVDTEKNARGPEAQLIRAGLWEPYEVGWLMASIKGVTVMLAKVTPIEQRNIDEGWITSTGQLILKRSMEQSSSHALRESLVHHD